MENFKNGFLRNFYLLWAGQFLTQLGSAMTSFAMLVWTYKQQGTVMSIALLSIFSFLPCFFISIVGGTLIDRFEKKKIMLICDLISAMCTGFVLIGISFGNLQIWHLYIINTISGMMNALQIPVSKVVITLIVPTEYYMKSSGLRSLADSFITVFKTVLASAIISFFGISTVLIIDLLTFLIAFLSLVFIVRFPEDTSKDAKNEKWRYINNTVQGFKYLKNNIGFLYLMLFMAGINFLAAIAFYSVLPAMILARTSGNEQILGLVNTAIGVGGIVGSLIVSSIKPPQNNVKVIFVSLALSFLLCDIFLGIGRSPLIWILAAFAGNLPIPLFCAAENALLQSKIPKEMLGRVFSIRGSLQFVTLPVGYLVGGYLADTVLEPFMANRGEVQQLLEVMVGSGKGSGMAVIFVITGLLGFVMSVVIGKSKTINDLERIIV